MSLRKKPRPEAGRKEVRHGKCGKNRGISPCPHHGRPSDGAAPARSRRRLCGRHLGRRRPQRSHPTAPARGRPAHRHRPGRNGPRRGDRPARPLFRPVHRPPRQLLPHEIPSARAGRYQGGRDIAGPRRVLLPAGRAQPGLLLQGGGPPGHATRRRPPWTCAWTKPPPSPRRTW